jgi:hypothetical protein
VADTSSGNSTVSVISKTIVRQYNEDSLSFGLISSGEEQPRPKCVACGPKLANQATVASKLKRQLHKKHSHLYEKPIEYFKRLIAGQTHQAKQWTEITTISDKDQEPSYDVAEIVAKKD